MASRRQPLTAPKKPKGADIEETLKFIREQQQKPSEAAAQAKILKNLSNQSKQREKYASQSKVFMSELKKLVNRAEIARQNASNSLIDLSGILPELPALLRIDAANQEHETEDYSQCAVLRDALTATCKKKRTPALKDTFNSQIKKFRDYLETMELPEKYDEVVEIVQRTKIAPAPKEKSYDLDGIPDEWKSKIEDQIAAFAVVENEAVQAYKKWLVDNGYDPESKCGGWDELEHQRFMLCGDSNLQVEFKDKGRDELDKHKRWVIRTQFLNKKKESLRMELQRRVQELKSEALRDAMEKDERERMELIAEERRNHLAEEKEELNSRLAIERKAKQERDAAKAARLESERKQKMEEDRKKKAIEDRKIAEMKKRVSTEKERKQQRDAEMAERRRQAMEKEKAIQRQRLREAKVHIDERKQMFEAKVKQRHDNEEAAAAAAAEKQRRLDALAQSVRDEFGLDNLESDPTRLTKLQELRRNMDKEERPMYVQTSFASSVIEADPRVRIENALREAGLINSPYAQQVMREMSALRSNQTMSSNVFLG